MITIYIIESGNKSAEVIIHYDNHILKPVQKKRVVNNGFLYSFYEEWVVFYNQTRAIQDLMSNNHSFSKEVLANLTKKGETLSSLLFGEELSPTLFRKSKTLVFSVDAQYANLPLELITVGQQFIVDRCHVLRQVRSLNDTALSKSQKSLSPVFFWNSTNVNLNEIVLREEENIAGSVNMGWKTIDCATITDAKFIEELHTCNYLHFAGHTDSTGFSVRNNKKISTGDISRLNLQNIAIAFFNSCYSSKQNTSIDSLSQAFIKAGVKNYIGYSLPVRNDIALKIAEQFWRGVKKKKDIHRNINDIRLFLKEKYGDSDLTWLTLHYSGTIEKNQKSIGLRIASIALVILLCVTTFFMYNLFKLNIAKNINKNTHIDSQALNLTLESKKQQGNVTGSSVENVEPKRSPTNIGNNALDKLEDAHTEKQSIPIKSMEKEETSTQVSLTTDEMNEKDAVSLNENEKIGNKDSIVRRIEQEVENDELKHMMIDFIESPHPFYSNEQRESIVAELIEEPMTDSMKIISLKQELVK
jgi:hypothetical protein